MGPRAHALGEEAIARGADIVYVADHKELEVFRIGPATRVAADAAQLKDAKKTYDKPRYFLFPATNNGRDLSATVAGRLDTGLASDCNLLYIEDVPIKHKVKSGGEEKLFPRILHMKRPDFSGYEWSTILCIDNPDRDFHPQCASVIPGSFQESEPDPERRGEIREIPVHLTPEDLRVKVVRREQLPKGVDLTDHDAVIALGRGIGEDPTRGIKLGVELAKTLGGDVGVSRGVVTASYQVEPSVEQYVHEERQIGETGQIVAPKVYVALGISGAIQHKKGMDKSKFIITVNTEEDTPIRDFSDVYVVADLFEFAPRLNEAIRRRLEGGA
jgi:electron transfer flavoprotein alpha subunit